MNESEFLRAICESPDDDLPRLVYADRLEELGECERAEFIRVQCELWNYPRESAWLEQMPVDQWSGTEIEGDLLKRLDPLVRRHTELCNLHVKECRTWSREFIIGILGNNWIGESVLWDWRWSRGFVSEIRLPLAAFVGGPCGRCDGTGLIGPVNDRDKPCPNCPDAHPGRTEGHAAAIFAAHPVTRVVLTDLRPSHTDRDPGFNCWFWQNEPLELGISGWFATEDEANESMSHRAVAYGRKEAGLSSLAATTGESPNGRSALSRSPRLR